MHGNPATLQTSLLSASESLCIHISVVLISHDSLKFVTVLRCVAVCSDRFSVCNGLARFLSPLGCDFMYRTMVRRY